MGGEDFIQRVYGQMSRAGNIQIFTERQAMKRVNTQTARKVALSMVDFEQGRSCKDDVKLRIIVVDVLDLSYPRRIFVNLVKKEVGYSVCI